MQKTAIACVQLHPASGCNGSSTLHSSLLFALACFDPVSLIDQQNSVNSATIGQRKLSNRNAQNNSLKHFDAHRFRCWTPIKSHLLEAWSTA